MVKNKTERRKLVENIEYHLYKYKSYKTGIINLQRQLDYIMPNVTTSYTLTNTKTGTFNIESTTEEVAIDRIESRKALNLREEIERYQIIINAIDEALRGLSEKEQEVIKLRYFDKKTFIAIALKMDYSERQVKRIKEAAFKELVISLRIHF